MATCHCGNREVPEQTPDFDEDMNLDDAEGGDFHDMEDDQEVAE